MSAYRRIQIGLYLPPCTKLNSTWIEDLTIKLDTLNLTLDKVGKCLELIGTPYEFINRIPIVQTLRSTINKWELMKLKSFCKAKDSVNRT